MKIEIKDHQLSLSNFTKRLRDFQQSFEVLSKQILMHYSSLAKEAVFDKHPEIVSFSFKCYTPHFNDGDVCEYGIYADDFDIMSTRPLTCGDDSFPQGNNLYLNTYCYRNKSPDGQIVQDIHDFVWCFPEIESLYKRIFGDGVRITVYADKCVTEPYDHD